MNKSGAELFSLFSKKFQKEFIWNGDPEFWQRRSPLLFPIVGRLKDDTYEIEGNRFSMKQHGFARDLVFNPSKVEKEELVFELFENEETMKIYPFRFILRIAYKIEGAKVKIKAEIENRDDKILPFSFGFHPAFVCPFNIGEKIEDYYVVFEKEEICERFFLENGLISNKELFNIRDKVLNLSENLFENDAVILGKVLSKKVFLQRKNGRGSKIEVAFKGFQYLGLWKKKDAPFLCIEPWNGLPDYKESDHNFIRKSGINFLERNCKATYEMEIGVFE